MKLSGLYSQSTRLEKSIAELEAEFAGKRIAPVDIALRFLNTTDSENFEERLAQLSPALRQLIEGTAKNNVLTFESLIADRIERQGYPGGWIALRDWARRQPWLEEAIAEAKRIQERNRLLDEAEAAGDSFADQGRILGMLRVHRMRATTDEERDALTKEIEEVEAAFTQANRAAGGDPEPKPELP